MSYCLIKESVNAAFISTVQDEEFWNMGENKWDC
jgi:hypothetical protein